PDLPLTWTYTDEYPDLEARKTAFEVFEQLSKLSKLELGVERGDDNKPYLRFSDEAQDFFIEWYSELECDLRSGAFEHPALESHFAKYRSLMPAFALIFELIDGAVNGFDGFEGRVSIGSAKVAAGWCSFLMPHAKRIFGLGISATADAARTLAGHIQKSDVKPSYPEGFTARDVYFKGWSGLASADAVREPIELLEHLGWIRGANLSKSGRPTIVYAINPNVQGVKP